MCGLITDLCIPQTPHELVPKLFGPLRERYADRPGGYTRVLRVEPKKDDQAPSAILELVDGPKDMRFALTARILARQRTQGFETLNETAALNVRKVTRYRKDGVDELEAAIKKLQVAEKKGQRQDVVNTQKKEADDELEADIKKLQGAEKKEQQKDVVNTQREEPDKE